MLPIALKKLQDNQLEDVAYFEPYYLKDFVAKKSVVRGLR
jgi:tRNA threonylcarbamoyladenosine biosynthesis protein TsaB